MHDRTLAIRRLATLAGLLIAVSLPTVGSAQDDAVATPVVTTDAPSVGASQIELSIWRTPAFRRRFAESFAAEGSVEPPVDGRDLAALQDAMDLMARNEIDAALSLLNKGRSARSSAALDFMVGNLLYVEGRLGEAADALEVAVGKFPDFRRAWVRLGDLEARRRNPDAAVLALTRAFELGATDAFTVGLLGWSHARLGNWVSAESAYRRAIMLDPTSYEWREGLAETLVAQRRESDAIALLAMLVSERPANPRLWRRIGEAKLAAGLADEAAQDLEVVRELGAVDAEVERMLGDIYLQRGLAALAVERHLSAIEADDARDTSAAFEAAGELVRRGDLAPVAAFLDAIRDRHLDALDDDGRAALGRLGTMLAARRSAGAVEAAELERIVERDPLDGEALILLGRYHVRQPDGFERGEYWFERAEGLPEHEVDAKIRHAEALVSLGRYAEAINLLKQAQSLRSTDAVKAYLTQIESYARNQ